MTIWSIEPRDTLVVRDGRPAAGDSAQMTGLPLPYPQATAGLMRTRSSVDTQGAFVIPEGVKKEAHLASLRQQITKGPWFGLLNDDGGIVEHLFPAPRDAVFFRGEHPEDTYYLRLGLRSEAIAEDELCDLTDQHVEPLFLSERVKDKPSKGLPLWRWTELQDWLENSYSRYDCEPEKIGSSYPITDVRTGIQIDPGTQTVKDGALFSIEHRSFHAIVPDEHNIPRRMRLCLLVETDMEAIEGGVVPFAGKRRSVFLEKAKGASLPKPPSRMFETIAKSGRLRVLLATPAYFDEGWRPSFLLEERCGVKPSLKAAIVPRPQVVSGWDFDKRAPKPTRRLVPAGAVYFLTLDGSEEERMNWLETHWWEAISDDPQARNDGYGLALFGVDENVGGDK
jgi:CRISPR-associated protein Cmr3